MRPTVAATAPPMPTSTSSKISVGTLRRLRPARPGSRARGATVRRPTRRARAAPAVASDESRRGIRHSRRRNWRARAVDEAPLRIVPPAIASSLHHRRDRVPDARRADLRFVGELSAQRICRRLRFLLGAFERVGVGICRQAGEPRRRVRSERGQCLGTHAMLARRVVERRRAVLRSRRARPDRGRGARDTNAKRTRRFVDDESWPRRPAQRCRQAPGRAALRGQGDARAWRDAREAQPRLR